MIIKVRNTRLWVSQQGSGPNIVLLHGNQEDQTEFAELIAVLKHTFTLIAVDTRGHGQSDPGYAQNYQVLADDVLDLCDILKLQHPAILGFSDGAITALEAMLKKPQYFSKAILCGVNIAPEGLLPQVLTAIQQDWRRTENPWDQLMLSEPHIDPESLTTIETEILLIYGAHDVFTQAHIDTIYTHLKHVHMQVIQNADHGSYLIHSAILAPYIQQFMAT